MAVICLLFLQAAPLCAFAAPVVSVDGDAAVDEQLGAAGVGISDFHRARRGSASPLPHGADVGYRYITGAAGNMVLVAFRDEAVLYVPPETCAALGVDVGDPQQAEALVDLLRAIDSVHAEGGVPLGDVDADVVVTSEAVFEGAGRTYRFAVESQGRFYAAVQSGPQQDATPLFCDYGALSAADAVGVVETRPFLEELQMFFARVDFSPLWVSLRTTLAAMVAVAVLGTLAGWIAMRVRSAQLQNVLDVVFTLPMVLPPTVCGFLLLWATGKNSALGRWLISMGVNIPFTWTAAVIAAAVVAFPIMYRSARGGLEGVDSDLLDAARTLGWSEPRVLFRLALPLAAPSLAAGAVLAFARALGEFGATMFFAGNYAGVTQTIPLAIYYDWMAGDVGVAWLWVAVMLLFTFVFVVLTRLLGRKR